MAIRKPESQLPNRPYLSHPRGGGGGCVVSVRVSGVLGGLQGIGALGFLLGLEGLGLRVLGFSGLRVLRVWGFQGIGKGFRGLGG